MNSADAARQRLEARLSRDRSESVEERILEIILQPFCIACEKPAAPGKPLCSQCLWLVQHGKKPCPACGMEHRDHDPLSVP